MNPSAARSVNQRLVQAKNLLASSSQQTSSLQQQALLNASSQLCIQALNIFLVEQGVGASTVQRVLINVADWSDLLAKLQNQAQADGDACELYIEMLSLLKQPRSWLVSLLEAASSFYAFNAKAGEGLSGSIFSTTEEPSVLNSESSVISFKSLDDEPAFDSTVLKNIIEQIEGFIKRYRSLGEEF